MENNVNVAPSEAMQGAMCGGAFRCDAIFEDESVEGKTQLAFVCSWHIHGMGAQLFQLSYQLQPVPELQSAAFLPVGAPIAFQSFVNITLKEMRAIVSAGPAAGNLVEEAIKTHGFHEQSDADAASAFTFIQHYG